MLFCPPDTPAEGTAAPSNLSCPHVDTTLLPAFLVRSRNSLFLVPSPTYSTPERAQRVKGSPQPRAATPGSHPAHELARGRRGEHGEDWTLTREHAKGRWGEARGVTAAIAPATSTRSLRVQP